MDKNRLEEEVEKGRSTREIAESVGISQSNVRRWLNKFGMRTKVATSGIKGVHRNIVCVLCGKKTVRGMRVCQSCTTRIRRYRVKKLAVEMLGGVCMRCGWSGGLAGFEFHHKGGKEFTIGEAANKSWDVVKKEMMKCDLLCSCCHHVEHSDYQDEEFMKEAERYKGRVLGA